MRFAGLLAVGGLLEDLNFTVDTKYVRHFLRKLGVAAFALRRWTPAEDTLLGTDDDELIAAEVGRTPMAVSLRRRAKGSRLPRSAAGRVDRKS